MNTEQGDASPPHHWSNPDWHAHVMAWLTAHLDAAGIRQVGPAQVPRFRPWAAVLRIPTDHGDIWFKAASGATAHEIAIYHLLARHGAELILRPIAVDTDRSWILLPDGGRALRDVAAGDALVDHWDRIVADYAQLQRSLMPETGMLLSLGVPDMRPENMPQRFDEGVEIARAIIREQGVDEDRSTLAQIEAFRPQYVAWCEELASSPVPVSLDHSDLHGGNVLMGPAGQGDARLYDWGDSVVAAPFSSLLVLLRSVQVALGCGPDDSRLHRIRDAYLEVYSDMDGHDRLVRTLELACRVSKVIRAQTWARALSLGPTPHTEWMTAPLAWMASVTETHYLE
jgi:hypothetical protein